MSGPSSAAAAAAAQQIAVRMRDFVNASSVDEADVTSFLQAIGGLRTVFGLVVAISDSLHQQLVRRVLARLFATTPGGRARLCSPDVQAYLLAGLQDGQLKHVQLLALQQCYLFLADDAGLDCLLDSALLDRLLCLLEGVDTEVTEAVTLLLLELGRLSRGAAALFGAPALRRLLEGTIDGEPTQRPRVLDDEGNADGEQLTAPFLRLLQQQQQSAASDEPAPAINSTILLRVLTLLTHVACGTRPANSLAPPTAPTAAPAASTTASAGAASAAAASSSAAAAATAATAVAAAVSPSPSPVQRTHVWSLFCRRGVWSLVRCLSSLESSPTADLLVQLSALELVEEVLAGSPCVDDAFATQLTTDMLRPAVAIIEQRASEADTSGADPSSALLPTSSFLSVGVLRVLRRLAGVSSACALHGWYRSPPVRVFLSAALQAYDDESVQAEALDVLAHLASFAEGLHYASTATSALSAAAQAAPAKQAAYLSTPYASSASPVLLLQLPFFVHGSNYASGLRQLAALHGLARIVGTKYPDPSAEEESAYAGMSAASASGALAATSAAAVPSSPSLQARRAFCMLSAYTPSRAPLDVLLLLAKQPFEDVREAVYALLLALTAHRWGIVAIAHTGGFSEYLLDRKTEFHISGMRAKYDIIKAIDESPHANAAFPPQTRTLIHEYVRQGAHYAPLHVGVMAPVAQFQ